MQSLTKNICQESYFLQNTHAKNLISYKIHMPPKIVQKSPSDVATGVTGTIKLGKL